MDNSLIPYAVTALWFTCWGFVLHILTGVYVRSLIAVGSLKAFGKVLVATTLWLSVSVVLLAPLFGSIAITNRYFPVLSEWPGWLWPVVCYLACLIPAYKAINGKHLPALQAAGFFLK